MTTDYDVFDEVFAEDDEQKTAPVNPPEDPDLEDPEAPIEPDGQAEDSQGEADGNPADESPEDTPKDEEPIDYKTLYEKAEQRFKSFEGRYKKEKETWERTVATPPSPPVTEPPKGPAAEDPEEAFLQKFRQEYNDDVIRAVEMISARKAKELLTKVESERIEPLQQAYIKTAQEAHFSTIASAHKDWREVVDSDEFNGWVDKQPGFLKTAYSQVLERGTANDVVDLLATYKSAVAAPTPRPAPTNVDPARVRGATAVRTSRGVMPSAPTARKTDFDSAWDEAPD